MKPSAIRRSVAAATVAAATVAAALAGLFAAAAGAAPVGLIREIPMEDNVSGIAGGPEGNLWFTQNSPFSGGRRVAIGRITPNGRVTRFRAGLSRRTEPLEIVAGPDGNLWFTYDAGIASSSGGGIGRITPGGRITLFPEPPDLHGSPFEIVVGPDRNLWFSHAAILTPTGQAIGRITPAGEITEFDAGLRPGAAVTSLTAGPDGSVWFGDDSSNPAIGRITPSGEITEFGGIPPREFPILEGPTPGSDGNLWFSANEPTALVERITPAGTIERFGAGLDRRAEYVGPFARGADGNIWFRVEKRPPRRRSGAETGRTAIGRIGPSGAIAEFSDCLREMPLFAGPNFLTRGPDGNVWFTTWPSGDNVHPTRASVPSIGRVTPAGQITEFRFGLHKRSQPESLLAAGGRLWFIDRETNTIGTIAPSRAPANTFLVLSPQTPRGSEVTRVPVVVPGPGKLRLRELGVHRREGGRVRPPGLRTIAVRARRCGPTVVPLAPSGAVRRKLRGRGVLQMDVRITFTPRGGSAFSRRATVPLQARRSRVASSGSRAAK
jgi:streptogramin lyase